MTTRRNMLTAGAAIALAGAAAYAVVRDMGSMGEYDEAVAVMRAALRQAPELADFLRYAALAPSGHNTQPWRFRASPNEISILPDFTRRTPVVDPDDHHLFTSLGCAAENLALACQARGRSGELRFDPTDDGALVFEMGHGTPVDSALFDAIPKRQSCRADYDGKPAGAADLRMLLDAASMPGVDVVLITDRQQIGRVRDLVVAGNSLQIADPAFRRELRNWIRFSPREALRTGDGLFVATTGNPILPSWLGPVFFDLAFKAAAENDRYASQIASSAGVAVFVSEREDHAHWALAGRAAQRFALQATALGLKCAFINQPVEVAGLRPQLASLIGLPGRRPDLVMRFGVGPDMPISARRPPEA